MFLSSIVIPSWNRQKWVKTMQKNNFAYETEQDNLK